MEKVYILVEYDHENPGIMGIYRTPEAAKDAGDRSLFDGPVEWVEEDTKGAERRWHNREEDIADYEEYHAEILEYLVLD